MFIGLYNKYDNLEKSQKNKNNTLIIDEEKLNQLNFEQPTSAQLISSSLGQDNKILLRYLYEGNNVLVVLNTKKKQIKSIITVKKGSQFGLN